MSAADALEAINKLATTAIAAISVVYVYLKYRRAQRWKAADLAARLVRELDSEPALALSCHALDWGVGPLLIPEQYRPLFPKDSFGGYEAVMEHDTDVLALALEPILNKETLRDRRGLVYRFCFIKLFDHLENLSRLLNDGQLRDEDLVDVKYWLECLRYYQYAPQGRDGEQIFQPALRDWGYEGVIALAERLCVKPWVKPETVRLWVSAVTAENSRRQPN